MKSNDKIIIDIASKELAKIPGYSCLNRDAEVSDTYYRIRELCGCWWTTRYVVTFQIVFRKPEDTYDTEPRVAHVEYAVCQSCGTVVETKLSDQLKSHDKN